MTMAYLKQGFHIKFHTLGIFNYLPKINFNYAMVSNVTNLKQLNCNKCLYKPENTDF